MSWPTFAATDPPPLGVLHLDERDPGHTPAIADFFARAGTRARLREVDGTICVRLVAASFGPDDPVPQREIVEARLHAQGVLMRRRSQTGTCTTLTDEDIAHQWAQLPDRQRDASVLLLLIVNTVVDGHHDVLDEIRARIDLLDQQLLAPNPALNEILPRIQQLGHYLAAVRDGLIPLRPQTRELMELREPIDRGLISHAAARWLVNLMRDLAEEVPASLAVVEKRVATTMGNLHGERSESTNRIVALLTVITAALFVPTLLTGVYGMNVPLPGQDRMLAFWVVIGLTSALILVAAVAITKMGLWGTFRRVLPMPKDMLAWFEIKRPPIDDHTRRRQ